MDKLKAIETLEKRREEIAPLMEIKSFSPQFKKWISDTFVAIKNIFGENTGRLIEFNEISYSLSCYSSSIPDYKFEEAYRRGLENAGAILSSMIDEIKEYWTDGGNAVPIPKDSLAIITNLCNRFQNVVKQLRQRHDGRETLDVNDEYDVQDLFHSLLTLFFDDIRPEEWTPSYAGGSSRMDFLLDDEGIVVELKMTRKRLANKEAAEQLIIDKEKYKTHPKCKHLICFVYDPDGRIKNPRGFEKDLSQTGEHPVTIYVRP